MKNREEYIAKRKQEADYKKQLEEDGKTRIYVQVLVAVYYIVAVYCTKIVLVAVYCTQIVY